MERSTQGVVSNAVESKAVELFKFQNGRAGETSLDDRSVIFQFREGLVNGVKSE